MSLLVESRRDNMRKTENYPFIQFGVMDTQFQLITRMLWKHEQLFLNLFPLINSVMNKIYLKQ